MFRKDAQLQNKLIRPEFGQPSVPTADSAEETSRMFPSMGTIMNLRASGGRAQEALDAAEKLIGTLNNRLSRMHPESEISRLNFSAAGEWIEVSDQTDAVLRQALFYARSTHGVYDPTIGRLVDLWDIANRQRKKLPDPFEIQRVLLSCDYRNLETDFAGNYRTHLGASLDLGGIAKGFAADQTAALWRQYDVESGLIFLGSSSLAAIGAKPDGSPWRIGIKSADAEKMTCLGVLMLTDQFLSTSGDYEQFFVKNDHRYHHILDKKTGYPAASDLRSVTVVADNGALCEAYSTALLIMGLDKALEFYEKEGGFEAVFVTSDDRVMYTEGLETKFEFRGVLLGYHCSACAGCE